MHNILQRKKERFLPVFWGKLKSSSKHTFSVFRVKHILPDQSICV